MGAQRRIKSMIAFLAIVTVFATMVFVPTEVNAATTVLNPAVTAKVKGVKPDVLNVRKGPGTNYAVVATLKEGASISVIGYTATTGGWLQIKAPAGYVSAAYVNVPVTGLKAAAASTSVVVGKTVTVKMNIVPACATNKKLTWTSNNTGVATVSTTGVVTGKKVGTATITAKTADGGKTATTTVTVTPVPVTGVSLNKTTLTVGVGEVQKLIPTVAPANAANKAVTWTSSDTTKATVDANGEVSGVAVGSSTVTVKTVDGAKVATCVVTVVPPVIPTGVSLDKTQLNLTTGSSATLTPTVIPANATNKTITWTTSDSKVATVDENGVVTGTGPGIATITATTKSGGCTAICNVTVKLAAPVISSIGTGGAGKVKVTWGKVIGASSYQLSRSTSQTGTYTVVKPTNPITNTYYTDSPGYNTFWYKVKAIAPDATYNSEWSLVPKSFNTLLPPASVKPGAVTAKSIKISWSKASGATNYQVWRAVGGKNNTYLKVGTTAAKTRTYTDKDVTVGKNYYYKIKTIRISNGNTVESALSSVYACSSPSPYIFKWPTLKKTVTSGPYSERSYGYHMAIDIAYPKMKGDPITAAAAGTVVFAGTGSDEGKYVVIAHGDKIWTAYKHNSKLVVAKDDVVTKGQKIAEAGGTGSCSPPGAVHCHFEVRKGKNLWAFRVDPYKNGLPKP